MLWLEHDNIKYWNFVLTRHNSDRRLALSRHLQHFSAMQAVDQNSDDLTDPLNKLFHLQVHN